MASQNMFWAPSWMTVSSMAACTVVSAVAGGRRDFAALAVVAAGDQLAYPCGACRQVLAEFAPDGLRIFIAREDDLEAGEETTLGELLPRAFRLG